MDSSIRRFFKFKERGTNFPTEIIAGLTTFATMSYIIFLQPAIMSGQLFNMSTGMDFGALLTCTCMAAAAGSLLMGLIANYPVALAPGMGENFFFVLTVLPVCASVLGLKAGAEGAWRLALGIVFVSGVVFAIISFCNIRKLLLNSISPSMKAAIAAGIGLFIAFIGLKNSSIIEVASGNLSLSLKLGQTQQTVFLAGLVLTGALIVFRVRGAILLGIVGGALLAAVMGFIKFEGFFSAPSSPAPIFAKMDVLGVLSHLPTLLPLLLIFLYMDVFDTLGTLVGVGTEAGLMKDGKLENAERAFASDACGTVFGSVCGHSTVTSFIESAAGVEQGGRTGFAAVVAGLCFMGAIFFGPLVKAVSSCPAATAPALVIVGAMMMKSVSKIEWDDYSEGIPSFLVLAGIPFSYSIGDGLIMGFVLYPLIKLLGGKSKEAGWLSYALSATLILYVVLVKR